MHRALDIAGYNFVGKTDTTVLPVHRYYCCVCSVPILVTRVPGMHTIRTYAMAVYPKLKGSPHEVQGSAR